MSPSIALPEATVSGAVSRRGQIAVSTLRGRPRMTAYEITEPNRICAWNIMNIGWSPIVPQREFGGLVATREFPRSKAARIAQFLRPA
jgi:hypothetical protein